MKNNYTEILNSLRQKGNFRELRNEIPDDIINLSSNDYLGLNKNLELLESFFLKVRNISLKMSSTSSRLLTGNSQEYIRLEKTISEAYKKEACLIFNSGYHANVGILPAITGKNDLIVADKLVHASLIDGMQLSKAKSLRYRHLDYEHLQRILEKSKGQYNNIFIVTESIFSMDGDVADLKKLCEIKEKYHAFLYVDEAHALGTRGKKGLGCAEEQECIANCDFIMGTFGKALASIGAYVVCSNIFKQFLVNHSRTLIYTTALPPLNLAWTNYMFEKLKGFDKQRKHLQLLSKSFAKMLSIETFSHIVPFVAGTNERAIHLSKKLIENGYYVLPIRYPTVPKGSARLRFSLNAGITIEMLERIPQLLNE